MWRESMQRGRMRRSGGPRRRWSGRSRLDRSSSALDAARAVRVASSEALAAVRESGGAYVLVEDAAILQAILPLARLGGVFAEPAGATAYAGLLQAWCDGLVQPEETLVVINTGSGLKDVRAAMEVTGEARVIEPSLAAVRDALGL